MWPWEAAPPKPPKKFFEIPELPDPDPRTKDLFLMSGIWQYFLLIVMIMYLYVFIKLVPKKRRFLIERWNPEDISFFLNPIGFCANFIFTCGFFYYGGSKYNYFCQPVSSSENEMAYLIYFFMFSKFLEFFDTFWLALKIAHQTNRKFDSTWRLHLYHHSSVGFLSWASVKFVPGGSAAIMSVINSIAHCIYYSTIVKVINTHSSFTGCKTSIILDLQLALIFISCITSLCSNCAFPSYASFVLIVFSISLFYLGGKFEDCCEECTFCGGGGDDGDNGGGGRGRGTKGTWTRRNIGGFGGDGHNDGGDTGWAPTFIRQPQEDNQAKGSSPRCMPKMFPTTGNFPLRRPRPRQPKCIQARHLKNKPLDLENICSLLQKRGSL